MSENLKKYCISKIMDPWLASATNMFANYPDKLEDFCLLRGLELPLPFMLTLVCIPFVDWKNFLSFWKFELTFPFCISNICKMIPERFFSKISSSEISSSDVSSSEISEAC